MILNQQEVEEKKVEMEGTRNTYMKVLVDGPNFVMRKFRIEKCGNTLLHNHPWEHEIYVLSGDGKVIIDGNEQQLKKGDLFLVKQDIMHTFKNDNDEDFEFLCLIPKSADYNKK